MHRRHQQLIDFMAGQLQHAIQATLAIDAIHAVLQLYEACLPHMNQFKQTFIARLHQIDRILCSAMDKPGTRHCPRQRHIRITQCRCVDREFWSKGATPQQAIDLALIKTCCLFEDP
ncbi:hypothetical protein D3C72_1479090 [compost metagenome]